MKLPFLSVQVADFDMKRPNEQCPTGLTLKTNPTRTCGKSTGTSCQSIIFPTNNVPYKTVCGRVTAYTAGTPDAFAQHNCGACGIDDTYIDGVSITHGSPRKHIWSFASEFFTKTRCPCAGYTGDFPAFVGEDYTCEQSTPGDVSDPLWDGQGCRAADAMCCNRPSVPQFCMELPAETRDNIEVRLCTDEPLSNEDILLESIELYIM